MGTKYHYPPELFQLLVEAIPHLFRSKRDVCSFFKGAGVSYPLLGDLEERVAQNRDSISKADIVHTVLSRLNEAGDKMLRERREVLKRIVEFEDYSTCWENDRLKAQGLVSRIQSVVDVKDSFTRMRQEREAEARKHREAQRSNDAEIRRQREILEEIRADFYRLFAMEDNPQARGRLLEKVLNRLFKAAGIQVSEDFKRVAGSGQGVVEQIDGIIEIDSHIYLVEMKWLNEPVSVEEVSRHLVRVFGRAETRGIFISYSEFTGPAIEMCKESLSKAVVALCTLQEFVLLMESETTLQEFLKTKIQRSMIDKQPFTKVLT